MNPVHWLIDTVLELYIWLIIASVILSWLVAFNVINTRNSFVNQIGVPLSGHRAGIAPDPERAAEPRRDRHFADDSDPPLIFARRLLWQMFA